MRETVEAMKRAYAALSTGQAEVPLRARLPVAPHQAEVLFMPAYVQTDAGAEALAVKIVSLFPENPAAGLPLIHATVLVIDPTTGQMQAVLEGSALTAIRTGAGAGAATDLLARPESSTAAILGAGVQARTQLEAVCAVRPIETAFIYSPTPAHTRQFIAEMAEKVPADLVAAPSAKEAVAQADIVCAATTSAVPVFPDAAIRPGTHINGVGSYTPDMIEIDPHLLARARITVDSRSAALAEAGELIHALRQGLIQPEQIAEIGEIFLHRRAGRTHPEEITYFKSVGVAVQDALAAQLAVENARKMGLGQE